MERQYGEYRETIILTVQTHHSSLHSYILDTDKTLLLIARLSLELTQYCWSTQFMFYLPGGLAEGWTLVRPSLASQTKLVRLEVILGNLVISW